MLGKLGIYTDVYSFSLSLVNKVHMLLLLKLWYADFHHQCNTDPRALRIL